MAWSGERVPLGSSFRSKKHRIMWRLRDLPCRLGRISDTKRSSRSTNSLIIRLLSTYRSLWRRKVEKSSTLGENLKQSSDYVGVEGGDAGVSFSRYLILFHGNFS